jgi:hypothetical protein
MGRIAKSVFTLSSVFLLSLGSFATDHPAAVAYNASVDRVFAAESQAFGAPTTSSEKGKCVVRYQSTGRYRLLWTASCQPIGKGQVSVTLTAEGQWFFGVGDEKKRVAKIFWDNMNTILVNESSSGGAPAASPLVAQPAPSLPPPAPSPSTLNSQPAPSLPPLVAKPAPPPSHPARHPASDTSAMVQISSEPSGADILVDGEYTGCTPSQLSLKPGPHSVRIAKKGFEAWERSITVESGESRNLAAELEQSSQ